VDLVQRRAVGPDWRRILTDLPTWLEAIFGHVPDDLALFERALTHGSHGNVTYERLEFLGDRVLGLAMSSWLYDRFPDDDEGKLSRRFNMLVSGEACAEIARDIGVAPYVRLGKQARDDGASDSDNVLGDVVEALIGALYLEKGMEPAARFIRTHWEAMVDGQRAAPRHPKSALQEWAAAQGRRPPVYEVIDRSGPHHAPRFTVKVSIGSAGTAQADGGSKQEAETAAAAALLEQLG
jgi:ribonuclease III